MNQRRLQGKVILVTGAAKRVGSVIAQHLHQRGATVVLHYRAAQAEADNLVEALNAVRSNSALALQADLLDVAIAPTLIADVLARFGRLDGLVNNAGIAVIADIGLADQANKKAAGNFPPPFFVWQS